MNETMTVNGRTFHVIRLLGKGKGGYSYLVTDGVQNYVCKQIHHEPCSYYTFGNKMEAELNDYSRLSKTGIALPRLLDADLQQERILKEYIDGPTADALVRHDAMKPEVVDQVRQMAALLAPYDLNIDWYPTNFVLQDGTLYYIDYECNPYSDQWNLDNWGIRYWSKTPEFLEALGKAED